MSARTLFAFGAAGLMAVAIGCSAETSSVRSAARNGSADAEYATDEAPDGFDGAKSSFADSDLAEPTAAVREIARTDDAPMRRPAASGRRQTEYQSGTLTAGHLDDHVNFGAYRDYLQTALQRDARMEMFLTGKRVEIRVQNESGEGIGDARVTVRPASQQQQASEATAALSMTTHSDGRAVLLTGVDAVGSAMDFVVTVQPPDGAAAVTTRVSLDQTPWTITLPQSSRNLPTGLDLALVIDTTGSMSDELEYLKVEIDSIAQAVHSRFPEVKQRYSLILYRDDGDKYVTRTFDFTDSLSEFRETLSRQSANGGGDYPEAMHLGLAQAEQLSWRRKDTARVLFLVADAPPHDRFAGRTMDAVRNLRTQGVTIYPVAASGTQDYAEFVLRAAAFLTQGRYLFLTDHSGVGNPHAKPHAPRYDVERLDQLMIRMIATELAGKLVLPRDIIATEQEDPNASPENPPLPAEQNQTLHVPPLQYGICGTSDVAEAGLFGSVFFRWLAAGAALIAIVAIDHRFRV